MCISWIFIYFDNILNIIPAIGLLVNLDNKKETSTYKTYTYFSTKDLCCEVNLLRSIKRYKTQVMYAYYNCSID